MDLFESQAQGAIRPAQRGVPAVGFTQALSATAIADAVLAAGQANLAVSS
jgi:hypothetical protein